MKHYWFGMEWSMAYYLAYNCKGNPLKPEFVFEVGGNIDFKKGKTKINEIFYLHKPVYFNNKAFKDYCLGSSWTCDNQTAEFIYKKWFSKRTPIEYSI
jgi:hypothetical protein